MKVITDVLDKVHVTQLVQHQVPRLMGEWHLKTDKIIFVQSLNQLTKHAKIVYVTTFAAGNHAQ